MDVANIEEHLVNKGKIKLIKKTSQGNIYGIFELYKLPRGTKWLNNKEKDYENFAYCVSSWPSPKHTKKYYPVGGIFNRLYFSQLCKNADKIEIYNLNEPNLV